MEPNSEDFREACVLFVGCGNTVGTNLCAGESRLFPDGLPKAFERSPAGWTYSSFLSRQIRHKNSLENMKLEICSIG